jgi:hypothetical protein
LEINGTYKFKLRENTIMAEKRGLYDKKNITEVLKNSKNLKFEKNHYVYTYNKIIKHFSILTHPISKNKIIDEDKLIDWLVIGNSIVYSWMPTIFNIGGKKNNGDDSLKFIRNIKNETIQPILENFTYIKEGKVTDKQLEPLRVFINNSVVGMSKFLHFSFPYEYPIWDSKVESNLSYNFDSKKYCLSKNNQHRVNNLKNYMTYRESCKQIIEKDDDADYLFDKFNNKSDFNQTGKMRKIEYILFSNNIKKDNK